jgi:GntR family transcriptional regulator
VAQSEFSLDRSSGIPLGTQLAWRLQTLIASGRLAEGERLPGVRELAELAGVNVNTVRSVYARLADEGAIVSEHGRGTFVADARAARVGLDRVRAALGTDPVAAAPGAAAAEAGDGAPEVSGGRSTPTREKRRRGGASADPAPADDRRTTSAEARRRASLKAEIALLERELAALEPVNGVNEPVIGGRPTPQLLTAAELEAIRDELVERLRPLRADRTLVRDERERERLEPQPRPRQRAIATSTPRFESGPGGWSLRWRG